MEASNVPLSKSGLLAYSSVHFICTFLDTPRIKNCIILPPELKRCCHAVLTLLPNNRSIVHASPATERQIHLVDAVTGSPLALATPLVTPHVTRKAKNGQQPLEFLNYNAAALHKKTHALIAKATDSAFNMLVVSKTWVEM